MSRRINCLTLQPLALSLALLVTIAVAFFLLQRGDAPPPASSVKVEANDPPSSLKESIGRLPLYFVENRGQTDSQVAYYIKGRDKTVYFTPAGLTFALSGGSEKAPALAAEPIDLASRREAEPSARHVLKLDFIGAREVQPVGEEKATAIFSHFTGSKEKWQSGVPSYTRVVYRELWPGIDLEYAGTVNRMKYSFHVRPWADPSQIRLAYRGASGVRVNEQGELEVRTPVETLRDERPVSQQEIEGKQIEVATTFNLDQRDEESSYGFEVSEYDRTRELVIDPAVLVYAGYIGGDGGYEEGTEGASGVAVDSSGNAYIVGYTDSYQLSFPVTVGPDLTHNGYTHAYVAKVNAAGTALVYCGYIGGNGYDYGTGIAVDAAGNAYLTGYTDSTTASFPVTVGPDLSHNGGFDDAFVAKVNAAGTSLDYCGYIGGSGIDRGTGIAVDSAGNAYLTGSTDSPEGTFPETVGPDLTFNGSFFEFSDAFVAKVNAAGTALIYCGYLGGSRRDWGTGIAVDAAGNAYLTGITDSPEATFPVTVGPEISQNGGSDAFVAKVNASGTALVYCGYLGGSSYDYGFGIAVDSSGNAYLTGLTGSTEASFPVMVGPDLTHNGGADAFVAKVNVAGTALDYCGYLGGNGGEGSYGIAVDSSGNAYLTGYTDSTEASFPVTVGPDLSYNGGLFDAYVAKVNAAGTALVYCGYIGGSDYDYGSGIAVDAQGAAYVVGSTYSTETSFPDGDGFGALPGPDQTHNGFSDAFIAKISSYPDCAEGSIAPSSASFTPEAGSGTIGVTISPSCPWTAFSNVPWILLTSGANGSGGGTVGYSVEANTGNTTRSGTLTVAGLTFTIRQGIGAVAANAASYSTVALAPDSIASIFGSNLATSETAAETTSLPTSLAGTTVKVIDSANVERLAPLFYVSPRQINLLIPPATAPGSARLLVTAGDGTLALGEIMILSVSPGLFAANADAAGEALAYVVRVKADGTQSYEQILQWDIGLGRYVARPIDLGPAGETVVLVMYGTGVRGAAPGTVRAQIGGAEAAVSYAGPQQDYVGLDQLNLTIPRTLSGRGEVEVAILAENQAANRLRIKVQ